MLAAPTLGRKVNAVTRDAVARLEAQRERARREQDA
jgi:hypothetical protein